MRFFKASIKRRLFGLIAFICLLFVTVFALLYAFLYDDYVMSQNKNLLLSSYSTIAMSYDGNVSSLFEACERMDNRYGIKAIITSADYTVIYDNIYQHNGASASIFRTYRFNIPEDYVWDGDTTPTFMLYSDPTSAIDYLLLAGRLEGGEVVALRIPLPLIEANTDFAFVFMAWSGILVFLVCCLIAYVMANRISKPLVEINAIAKTMAKLDFSRKYSGKSKDEIGQLGESINSLSSQLEGTISRLQETNARLEVEIAKERQIDNMRKNFIANVSHELKTPLALVQGYAEGLKVNINDNEEDRNFYCDVIMEESARMTKLVQQLLDLAKIEVGNILPERELFDLGFLIDNVCAKNKLRLENKHICLLQEVNSIPVWADSDMTEQIFVNLLTNAINYSPEEGGLIEIRAEIRSEANKVRLFVRNRGDQIPEEELDNLWLNFYQVDKARTRAYGGTGIGLSVVAAIMKAHGMPYGAYNCRSAHGDGVEFYIELESR